MAGCTCPCSVVAEGAHRHAGLRPRALRQPLKCSLTSRFYPYLCSGFAVQICEYAGATLHVVSHVYLHGGGGIQRHIDSRTKLDQPHAFSAFHPIAHFLVEHDAPRQQSRDLLEYHDLIIALHRNRILFVEFGGGRVHGVEVFSFLITHVAYYTRQWRTVHVNIEYVEKNADPGAPDAIYQDRRYIRNFAVGGRYDRPRRIGNDPLRIAEKPQEENREQTGGQTPQWPRQPPHQHGNSNQRQSVIVAVSNHGEM